MVKGGYTFQCRSPPIWGYSWLRYIWGIYLTMSHLSIESFQNIFYLIHLLNVLSIVHNCIASSESHIETSNTHFMPSKIHYMAYPTFGTAYLGEDAGFTENMAPSTTSPTRPMQLGVTKARAWRFPTAFPIASDGVDSTWMYIFQFLFFVLFFCVLAYTTEYSNSNNVIYIMSFKL